MTKTTIAGMRGTPLPNLEAHGLARKMKMAAALIAEQSKLRERKSELGREQQGLREEIKRREREHTLEWGRAMRAGGDAPADKRIEKARWRLEEVEKEIAAVRRAGGSPTPNSGRSWPSTARSGMPKSRPRASGFSPRRRRSPTPSPASSPRRTGW